MPCGIIVNFDPKFATIERYFYDTDNREILTSAQTGIRSKVGKWARAS